MINYCSNCSMKSANSVKHVRFCNFKQFSFIRIKKITLVIINHIGDAVFKMYSVREFKKQKFIQYTPILKAHKCRGYDKLFGIITKPIVCN